MIIYFCLYSFLGYIMESIYVSLFQKKVISSGLLKGPYIPLYGLGAVILIILIPFIKDNLFYTFCIGGIMMTLLEYISSLYIEKVFHKKCWDYSQHPFHFQGRICLGYFFIWCILSCLLIFIIHPFFYNLIPVNDFSLIFSLIFIMFIVKDTVKILNTKKNNGLIL